jgi:hypothetical protein
MMMRVFQVWFAAALIAGTHAEAHTRAQTPAPAICASIAKHVDLAGGADTRGSVLLGSYEPGPGEASLPPPLASSAFSYDNALAIMALVACNDIPRAKRIGDAFVAATHNDRTFTDGRIRNAYRAGPVKPAEPLPLPGWWDDQQKMWVEDAYQSGTQTGNVAWVALALLSLDQATGSQTYRPVAEGLGRWIAQHAQDPSKPGGFSGGMAGFDKTQTRLEWRSTEHNVDVHALGQWLERLGENSTGRVLAQSSRGFLAAMFDETRGMFRLGTMPGGAIQPPDRLALDALIWPLIGVGDVPSAWRRSLAFAKSHLAVSGGFDFNGDRDGLWTEGTAQASLVERAQGDRAGADALLVTVSSLASASGYLYATGAGRITTGISIGPESKDADFYYFHRPHLGATAWAVLAATGLNPFTGRKVD